MIRFILLQNRQGKTRLVKYYVPLEDSEKHKVEYDLLDFHPTAVKIIPPKHGCFFSRDGALPRRCSAEQ